MKAMIAFVWFFVFILWGLCHHSSTRFEDSHSYRIEAYNSYSLSNNTFNSPTCSDWIIETSENKTCTSPGCMCDPNMSTTPDGKCVKTNTIVCDSSNCKYGSCFDNICKPVLGFGDSCSTDSDCWYVDGMCSRDRVCVRSRPGEPCATYHNEQSFVSSLKTNFCDRKITLNKTKTQESPCTSFYPMYYGNGYTSFGSNCQEGLECRWFSSGHKCVAISQGKMNSTCTRDFDCQEDLICSFSSHLSGTCQRPHLLNEGDPCFDLKSCKEHLFCNYSNYQGVCTSTYGQKCNTTKDCKSDSYSTTSCDCSENRCAVMGIPYHHELTIQACVAQFTGISRSNIWNWFFSKNSIVFKTCIEKSAFAKEYCRVFSLIVSQPGTTPFANIDCSKIFPTTTAERRIFTFGSNIDNRLGLGSLATDSSYFSPTKQTLKSWTRYHMKKAVTGHCHSLGLDSTGSVFGWGCNNNGQVDNSKYNVKYPTRIHFQAKSEDVIIKKVAAGKDHSLALDTKGRVWGWGSNSEGQLANIAPSLSGPTVIELCEKTEIGNKENITLFKFQNNFTPWRNVNGPTMWFDDGGSDMFDGWGFFSVCPDTSYFHSNLPAAPCVGLFSPKNPSVGNEANETLKWNGNSLGFKFGWIDNNVFHIHVWSEIDFSFYFHGNLGSDGSTVYTSASRSLAVQNKTTNVLIRQFTDSDYPRWDPLGQLVVIPSRFGENRDNYLNWNHNSDNSYGKTERTTGVHMFLTWGYINPDKNQAADIFAKYLSNILEFKAQLGICIEEEIIDIAAGAYHSFLLTSSGKVYATGRNAEGQLGTGNKINKNIPTLVKFEKTTAVVAISSKNNHNLAIDSTGILWAFGQNDDAQLCLQDSDERLIPTRVPIPSNLEIRAFSQASAGFYHSLVLSSNGALFGCGYNRYGQLGDGSTIQKASLTPILTFGNRIIEDISAGEDHSLVITNNDEIYTFGRNNLGQIGQKPSVSLSKFPTRILSERVGESVSAGAGFSVVVAGCPIGYSGENCQETSCFGHTASSRLTCSGHGKCVTYNNCTCEKGYQGPDCSIPICKGLRNDHPNVCSGNGTCVAVETCACKDGYTGQYCDDFMCFGVIKTSPDVCGGNGNCLGPNTCKCWDGYLGKDCSAKLGSNKEFFGFGLNENNQLLSNEPIILSPKLLNMNFARNKVEKVIASYRGSFFVANTRAIYVVGFNTNGQLGISKATPYISTPTKIPFTGPIHDAESHRHTLILSDGKLFSCGYNFYGQLGDGTTMERSAIVEVPIIEGGIKQEIRHMSTGLMHSMCITSSGKVYTFGWNNLGQLADFSWAENRLTPKLVQSEKLMDTSVILGECSDYSCVLLDSSNVLLSFGSNLNGELGINNPNIQKSAEIQTIPKPLEMSTSLIDQIVAGHNHFIVKNKNGLVFSWGKNDKGQLGIGNTNTAFSPSRVYFNGIWKNETIILIETGFDHSLAATNLGRLFVWGSNEFNQLGIDTNSTMVLTPTLVSLPINPGKRIFGMTAAYHTIIDTGCPQGFSGEDCTTPTCGGYSAVDIANVCSGNGICVSTNNCTCKPGFVGSQCEIHTCQGIILNDTRVCSGVGICRGVDLCDCPFGYSGFDCSRKIACTQNDTKILWDTMSVAFKRIDNQITPYSLEFHGLPILLDHATFIRAAPFDTRISSPQPNNYFESRSNCVLHPLGGRTLFCPQDITKSFSNSNYKVILDEKTACALTIKIALAKEEAQNLRLKTNSGEIYIGHYQNSIENGHYVVKSQNILKLDVSIIDISDRIPAVMSEIQTRAALEDGKRMAQALLRYVVQPRFYINVARIDRQINSPLLVPKSKTIVKDVTGGFTEIEMLFEMQDAKLREKFNLSLEYCRSVIPSTGRCEDPVPFKDEKEAFWVNMGTNPIYILDVSLTYSTLLLRISNDPLSITVLGAAEKYQYLLIPLKYPKSKYAPTKISLKLSSGIPTIHREILNLTLTDGSRVAKVVENPPSRDLPGEYQDNVVLFFVLDNSKGFYSNLDPPVSFEATWEITQVRSPNNVLQESEDYLPKAGLIYSAVDETVVSKYSLDSIFVKGGDLGVAPKKKPSSATKLSLGLGTLICALFWLLL